MKSCPEYQETLWLDVYGELAADERPAWQKHLEICNTCRLERQELLKLLDLTKEFMPSAPLSPEASSALQQSITRTLRKDAEEEWWGKRFFGIPARPIPALVAASLLLVVLGWFGLRQFRTPSSVRPGSNLGLKEEMIAKDMEIIENLELLEQMDVLEKVVHVVDDRDVKL
jgi:hypothetical protein